MAILVGTASWTDKTLIACKRFYPPEAKTAEARLWHYATQFPIVEVDSSYYAMPSPSNSQLWAERTPDDFVFNIKEFRLFTGHHISPMALQKDIQDALPPMGRNIFYYRDLPRELVDEPWRRFIEALAPLKQAGKLKGRAFLVRAVDLAQLRGACPCARVRRTHGGAPVSGGVPTPILVRYRLQPEVNAGLRARTRRDARDSGRTAGVQEQRADGVGAHQRGLGRPAAPWSQ
jgi:hypothetical protein